MAAPNFETLAYDLTDGVATVTLNRPDKLNAFNTQMMKDLIAVFDVTDADDDVRAETWEETVAKAFSSVDATGPAVDHARENTRWVSCDVTEAADLEKLLGDVEGKSILEVGCGSAPCSR